MDKQALEKLSKKELLDIATQKDLRYRTRMSKDELVDGLVGIENNQESPVVQLAKSRKKTKKTKIVVEDILLEKLNIQNVKQENQTYQNQEQYIEQTKYLEVDHGYQMHDTYESKWELPWGYNDNIIVAKVIDPEKIYAYWEIPEWKRMEFFSNLSEERKLDNKFVTRVHDVTDVHFNGSNSWSYQEHEVGEARNWFYNVTPNRSYVIESGVRLNDGSFHLFSRSNVVKVPRNSVSDIYDEEWMMFDFNQSYSIYDTMHRLSGGELIGSYFLNSEEVKLYGKKEIPFNYTIPQLNSEVLSSGSMVKVKKSQKDFWLKVWTELIVYGETEPDAYLTINGAQINLDNEGKFKLHMPLNDEQKVFDVHAFSNDRTMHRSVKPVVNRYTE